MWSEIGYSLAGVGVLFFSSYELGKRSARFSLNRSIKLLEKDKELLKGHIDEHKKLLDDINKHFIFF
tara:strand:+ start:1997 stop:2197 length:201 start_codon:yes stop_codon:yes gene_type:complete